MKLHALLAIWLIASPASAGTQGDTAVVGQKAPLFSGTATNGATVSLESLSGKVVLINFFATWCPPCLVEMPRIEKDIWQPNPSPDLKIIAVGRDHTAAELVNWKQAPKVSFTILADPGREIYGKYATSKIPRCYVIGRDGLIKYASTGYNEQEFDRLKAVIAAELKP